MSFPVSPVAVVKGSQVQILSSRHMRALEHTTPRPSGRYAGTCQSRGELAAGASRGHGDVSGGAPNRNRSGAMTHVTPYTLESFAATAQREDQQGRTIGRRDADVRAANRALSNRRKKYTTDLAALAADDPSRSNIRGVYRSERDDLRKRRDHAVRVFLDRTLADFETRFTSDEPFYELVLGPTMAGKPTYQMTDEPSVRFAARDAARCVRELADAEVPSRNSVVRALKTALGKSYLHAIVKLDISSFFESIPHRELLRRASALDSITTELLQRLLNEYSDIAGVSEGLPRGVGLSSQLAELYLADLDLFLMGQPGVLFYARYVDDVVLVLDSDHSRQALTHTVEQQLALLKLQLNDAKVSNFVTDNKGNYPPGQSVEYLGYSFTRTSGRLVTGLTSKRRARRADRLELSFEAWLGKLPNPIWPNHGANGLLIDRVRFLAGNTRLVNSKSNVAIGLYFSNSALDPDSQELKDLDSQLGDLMLKYGAKMTAQMRERMEEISFTLWFEKKTFIRFKAARVKQIVKVWEAGA